MSLSKSIQTIVYIFKLCCAIFKGFIPSNPAIHSVFLKVFISSNPAMHSMFLKVLYHHTLRFYTIIPYNAFYVFKGFIASYPSAIHAKIFLPQSKVEKVKKICLLRRLLVSTLRAEIHKKLLKLNLRLFFMMLKVRFNLGRLYPSMKMLDYGGIAQKSLKKCKQWFEYQHLFLLRDIW
jgi:hypothetical protein